MNRLLALAPIAALAVAGCGSNSSQQPASKPASSSPSTTTASATGPVKDAATLDEFSIKIGKAKLPAGKVQFVVKNTGKTEHEFVVLATKKSAADLGKGSRIPETGHLAETGNLKPGQSKTLTVNLKKGHYAVVCNDPGHYMAGMHKDLVVS